MSLKAIQEELGVGKAIDLQPDRDFMKKLGVCFEYDKAIKRQKLTRIPSCPSPT